MSELVFCSYNDRMMCFSCKSERECGDSYRFRADFSFDFEDSKISSSEIKSFSFSVSLLEIFCIALKVPYLLS